jgi:hypothetical protein
MNNRLNLAPIHPSSFLIIISSRLLLALSHGQMDFAESLVVAGDFEGHLGAGFQAIVFDSFLAHAAPWTDELRVFIDIVIFVAVIGLYGDDILFDINLDDLAFDFLVGGQQAAGQDEQSDDNRHRVP